MADPGPNSAPAGHPTSKAAETALAAGASAEVGSGDATPLFGGLDDPFGLLAGLDLGALADTWPTDSVAAALAASGPPTNAYKRGMT